ncbi:uncharacterized protein LOC111284851 [Durio zibethinus]|uniref:Uncharacterized protein LOC111284851 n=1 Tax=Durio zibethinus TaxID=66656 RepID=A0A6P5XP13_DURZI|nr:uncharacterized protein LOC111284851 [Durio zibethinus]
MSAKKVDGNEAWCSNLTIVEGGNNNEICDSVSIESSFEGNSENSNSSISSSDLVEDASFSATSSSSSLSSNGPLYELSELMAQLPIRRGLSKHYQGKSQSFTSLASVRSIEDLPKKVIPLYNRTKLKSCKSYGWGLDGHHNKSYSPKATISKKGSSARGCFASSLGKRSTSTTLVISE